MTHLTFLVTVVLLTTGLSFKLQSKIFHNRLRFLSMQSYLEELSMFKGSEKKVMVGFTTDQWSVGKFIIILILFALLKKTLKSQFGL